VNCLRKAMEYVVEDSVVKVHLQADDFQHIKEMSLEDPSLLQGTRRIELMEDPAVSRGGCLLQTDFGEVDATLDNCRERLFAIVERAFFEAMAAAGSE
ncbi:MAG: flagellar biosynthesis protein, partial [Deltaproteobacteria bacterium]|nr:flagellar biosynthesis protein [Deltaproteobacteria bacterium]